MPDACVYFPVGPAFPAGLLVASSIASVLTMSAWLSVMIWDWLIAPEWGAEKPPEERQDKLGG